MNTAGLRPFPCLVMARRRRAGGGCLRSDVRGPGTHTAAGVPLDVKSASLNTDPAPAFSHLQPSENSQ